MSIRSFLHVKIDVSDLDRSVHFYCNLLGLREIVSYVEADYAIVQVSPTGHPPGIELWYYTPPRAVSPRHIHIAFEVEDVKSLVEELRVKGVKIDREPFTIGQEVIAFINDPDDYPIELNQVTTAALRQ